LEPDALRLCKLTHERYGRPVGTRTPDLYRVNKNARILRAFSEISRSFIGEQREGMAVAFDRAMPERGFDLNPLFTLD
jgi:hypothetical protein